jgi:perosamine synthetase
MKRSIQIALPSFGEEEWQALREPLRSGWVTQGPKVAAFERAFAARHGVDRALATTSCTTGLHLILAALGIGPGDEVIVPSFTWVATANAVVYCGATPVIADVNRMTFNIDPGDVARRITGKTKAVIAVHLFGLCADMDALRAALPAHVAVVEDAACAAGASYKGVPAGGLGVAAAFSFHPRKSITTGEGGMVTTNNAALADTVDRLRNHGASISEEQRHQGPRPYLLPEFNLLGFNYRMTEFQGAVGLVQLGKLDTFIGERQRWANFYHQRLSNLSWLRLPAAPKPDKAGDHRDHVEELDRLFRQAVGRQLISDVEIGSYLSGGMDSGSITAIAGQSLPNLKTFTCGFDLSSASGLELSFDERTKAEAMSARFKTEHYEMVRWRRTLWGLPMALLPCRERR